MLAKVSNDFSTPIRKDSCRSSSCVNACLCCVSANRHSVLSCKQSLTRPTIAPHSCARQKPSPPSLLACAALRKRLGDTEQLSEQHELLIPAQYRVIPCGINFVAVDLQLLYLFRGGLNPGLVPLGIQHRFHSQPGAGSCCANQVDHRFQVP